MHAYVDFKQIVNVEATVSCYPMSMVNDPFTILTSREVIYEFNLNTQLLPGLPAFSVHGYHLEGLLGRNLPTCKENKRISCNSESF